MYGYETLQSSVQCHSHQALHRCVAFLHTAERPARMEYIKSFQWPAFSGLDEYRTLEHTDGHFLTSSAKLGGRGTEVCVRGHRKEQTAPYPFVSVCGEGAWPRERPRSFLLSTSQPQVAPSLLSSARQSLQFYDSLSMRKHALVKGKLSCTGQ